jgi:hypothetical protein
MANHNEVFMNMSKRMTVGGVAAMAIMGMVAIALAQTSKPADVTGTWKWTSDQFGQQQETTLTLKQEGDTVTGTITGFQGEQPISDGKVKDGTITFKVVSDFGGRQLVTNYTGTVSGDSFKGKSELVIANEFDAKRSK